MINKLLITASLLLINSTLFAQTVQVPKSEVASIFKAANFKKQNRAGQEIVIRVKLLFIKI